MKDWNIDQAKAIYNICHWGEGYFDINEQGHVVVCSDRSGRLLHADLHQVALDIRKLGLSLPVLVRFPDILHSRIDKLHAAFSEAIQVHDYQGQYTAVYPIKVNQQRTVVQQIQAYGKDRVGLEAGSKPELMAVIAYANMNGGLIICNGYKDREYIRLALIAKAMGHRVYIVIEKLTELKLVLQESEDLDITPLLGVRVRLASVGKGKWQNTGGERSKFGLSAAQIISLVEHLKSNDLLPSLQLIHFHLGSQLANIRDIQRGMKELARFYAELQRMGANIQCIDVGGGLAVDYEGTRSRSFCSMNYSMQEYANDVVFSLWEACESSGFPHPDIITESGRAMTAHHAVLITHVIDIERAPEALDLVPPAKDDPLILHNLWGTKQSLSRRSAMEAYHDAVHWLAEAQTLYIHGVLSLSHRAQAELLYYAICRSVRSLLQAAVRAHREVWDELSEKLADKYFCNLSIFQSLPDIWAIDQVLPIMPLHRLQERPTRRGIIQDLTCDSDGAIDHYVDGESIESTLPLHDYSEDEPYLLGIFMVGAYQEILGDLHNLFGDTHSINLEFTNAGGYQLLEPEQGDTIDDVLRYVHFSPEGLSRIYREKINQAGLNESQRRAYIRELDAGLTGYTYLET